MNATLQELKAAASALPAGDRAELAHYLLQSLDDQGEPSVHSDWLALASGRRT